MDTGKETKVEIQCFIFCVLEELNLLKAITELL